MKRLLVWAAILAALSLLVFGAVVFLFGEAIFGPDPDLVDRDNEEFMTSLPVYPNATLVRKYATAGETGRPLHYDRALTYEYATSADEKAVLAFYRQELRLLGAQPAAGKDSVLSSFLAGDFYVDVIALGQRLPALPSKVEVTPVTSPAAETTTYFAVRVSQ